MLAGNEKRLIFDQHSFIMMCAYPIINWVKELQAIHCFMNYGKTSQKTLNIGFQIEW